DESSGGLRRKCVNATFKFFPGPTAGARVVWIDGERRAGLASYAEIAFVVLRQMANAIRSRVVPDLFPAPISKQPHLPHIFAARKAMQFDFLEVSARRRLLAA